MTNKILSATYYDFSVHILTDGCPIAAELNRELVARGLRWVSSIGVSEGLGGFNQWLLAQIASGVIVQGAHTMWYRDKPYVGDLAIPLRYSFTNKPKRWSSSLGKK